MNAPIGTDTTPPVRSNGQPTGTLPAGTTQTTLSLTTNESATCRYGTTQGSPMRRCPTRLPRPAAPSQHQRDRAGQRRQLHLFRAVPDAATNANPDDFTDHVRGGQSAAAGHDVADGLDDGAGQRRHGVRHVTVSANASDNVGVVGVQFLLGGAPLGAEDTTAPYSITWNSTSVANGSPYQLSARARDAATNQTTATAVSVTVNNTGLGLVAAYGFNEGTGTTLLDRPARGIPAPSPGRRGPRREVWQRADLRRRERLGDRQRRQRPGFHDRP